MNLMDRIGKRNFIKILSLAIILIFAFFIVRASSFNLADLTPTKIKEYLLSFGLVKGALMYLIIYTFSIRPFVPIPPTLYTLAGGFTFGPILGTVLTVVGATLNATICFLLARALGKDFVDRLSKGRFEKVNRRLRDSSFKTLLIIRASPVGPPYDLVSYASGVLKIPFWSYFFATMLGIVPAVAVYSYFGGSITKGGTAILVGFFLIVLLSVFVPWYLRRRSKSVGNPGQSIV